MRLLSYISLALALLVATEWWSSYRGVRSAALKLPSRSLVQLMTGEGCVSILWGVDRDNPPPPRIRFHYYRYSRGGVLHPRSFWQRLGFYRGGTDNYTTVIVPHWLLVTLLTLPPTALWLYRTTRGRKRRRFGLCVRCGYDVRNTPDKCPECGAAVELKRVEDAAAGGERDV